MTKSAYLRVYSPEVTGSNQSVPGFVRSYGLLSEDEGDAHWTVEWEGRRLVCPRNLRLRVLESTVAFAHAYRGWGPGLIPEASAEEADAELKAYKRANPNHRSHILTSAWHVPVRWFAAFDPADKQIYETESGPRLRYRTDINLARSRLQRVRDVLTKVGVFAGPAEELAHVADWLEPFPEGSMVELDYASVSELFPSDDLFFDDSCEQVQDSVAALESGDMMRAGEHYGRVITRWAPAFAVTFSN